MVMCVWIFFFVEVHILHTRDTRVLKEQRKICQQYRMVSNKLTESHCNSARVRYVYLL